MNGIAAVSVIIPTFERAEALRRALDCVLADDGPAPEILVIDQSRLPFSSADSRIRVLGHVRPNLPGARNLGVRESHGEVVLFLDDDVVFAPGLIRAHVQAHAAHPDAGCVAGRIKLVLPHRWEKQATVARLDPLTAKFFADFDCAEPGYIDFPVGCNMSFKRCALARTGGFDENYIGNALYEEADFTLRMKRKGFRVFFEPRAVLTHARENRGGCRADRESRYHYIKFRNTGYFFFKNLFGGAFIPFFRAMKNEIEFYTRKPGGHSLFRAGLYFSGLLWGALMGTARRSSR